MDQFFGAAIAPMFEGGPGGRSSADQITVERCGCIHHANGRFLKRCGNEVHFNGHEYHFYTTLEQIQKDVEAELFAEVDRAHSQMTERDWSNLYFGTFPQ